MKSPRGKEFVPSREIFQVVLYLPEAVGEGNFSDSPTCRIVRDIFMGTSRTVMLPLFTSPLSHISSPHRISSLRTLHLYHGTIVSGEPHKPSASSRSS